VLVVQSQPITIEMFQNLDEMTKEAQLYLALRGVCVITAEMFDNCVGCVTELYNSCEVQKAGIGQQLQEVQRWRLDCTRKLTSNN